MSLPPIPSFGYVSIMKNYISVRFYFAHIFLQSDHSFMDRLWALWQDCHDFECPDCYQRNGAYDGYTYIETGRYWWNKNAAAWHEPTPRSIAENSKAAIV